MSADPGLPAAETGLPAADPGLPAAETGLPAADPEADTGPDAVRSALNRARAAARERGTPAGSAAPQTGRSRYAATLRRRADAATRSGAHPDARDPQPFAGAIARLIAERGWQVPLSVGGVMGRWDEIVGPEIAGHCRPEAFTEGVLTVVAESTAWATQVRLLAPSLLRRLAEEVGEGTVTKIVVRGPSAPSWRRGPRTVQGGQGPRDTYG